MVKREEGETMDLVFVNNNQVVTDSLTVAEVFRKEHKNILRDIDTQMEKLVEAGEKDWGVLNFEPTQYQHHQNKQWYPKYNLTEDAFAIIAMSYVTPEAMKMKVKFLNEFKRMKVQLTENIKPSYMIVDPIKRAEKWIEEQKQRLMLEQQVKENQAKVTYYDTILQSQATVTITQIAKDYGLSGTSLNKILHQEAIQYKIQGQWLLYADHQDKGYTKSKTHIDPNGKPRMHTYWTQKGRLFIHQILTKRNILPLIDREEEVS